MTPGVGHGVSAVTAPLSPVGEAGLPPMPPMRNAGGGGRLAARLIRLPTVSPVARWSRPRIVRRLTRLLSWRSLARRPMRVGSHKWVPMHDTRDLPGALRIHTPKSPPAAAVSENRGRPAGTAWGGAARSQVSSRPPAPPGAALSSSQCGAACGSAPLQGRGGAGAGRWPVPPGAAPRHRWSRTGIEPVTARVPVVPVVPSL